MRTTAVFEAASQVSSVLSVGGSALEIRLFSSSSVTLQEFIINSPDFEAAKFWVGNMGKTATHAVVYAQLYTPDQVCHGLHSFIVPVSKA